MGVLSHVKANPYSGYVLAMVTLVYLLNQVDRYLFSARIAEPPFVTKSQTGLITGPLFTLTYTVMGVLISFFGSQWKRARVLAIALIFWSGMTFATGFTTKFYQVAITRIGQSLGEAACTPFAAGIISDYFPPAAKGAAMSFYNIGIYTGYSLAQSTGGQITDRISWEASFIIYGSIGFVVAVLFWLTVREPKPNRAMSSTASASKAAEVAAFQPPTYKAIALQWVSSPSLVLFCIAGGVRNAGGYVWGYYTASYFKDFRNVSNNTYSAYMSWIPLVGGSLGAVVGGYISDHLVNRKRADGTKLGPRGRVAVVVVSQLLAAPFAAGAVLIHKTSPWAFLCLIPSNVIGEMWVGVCLAVIMDLTPKNMHTTSVAIYFFIITNIGGNAPALVPVLEKSFGGPQAFRNALLVLFPGAYFASAFLFMIAIFFLNRDVRIAAERSRAAQLALQGDDGGDSISDPLLSKPSDPNTADPPIFGDDDQY